MKIDEEILTLDLETIVFSDGEKVKNLITKLLNIVEQSAQINQRLQEENQKLKDEINRLKGEKGRPKIKPNVPRKKNDVPKQKKPKKWKKRSKKQRIKIDRKEIRRVDPSILPPDAKKKGYRPVPVQNIRFETDNVEYGLERYHSPSERRVYEAKLPEGVDGGFGAELKAFIHLLYFACRVPENKIWMMLTEVGIIISEGQISNILIKDKQEELTREKEEILKAGMASTDHFHTDTTGARHKGANHYIHVICTAVFSVFFITSRKNGDTIRNMLELAKDELIKKIMISDDAREYLTIAVLHALCWIHEIRHFRKLNPFLEWHHKKLVNFLTEVYNFYEMLKEYKKNPNEQQKFFLERKFDDLFSIKTGYEELDKRIALTKEKKDNLLLVLEYPWIPLHNNPAEIALRELVIKKKISYGTRSEDGRISWENNMTMLDTCRKNDVSYFEYMKDIFSGEYSMPRLATLIQEKGMVNPTTY